MSHHNFNSGCCSHCRAPGCTRKFCPFKDYSRTEARRARLRGDTPPRAVRVQSSPSRAASSVTPCHITYWASLEKCLVKDGEKRLNLPDSLRFTAADTGCPVSWFGLHIRAACSGGANPGNLLRLCVNCQTHVDKAAYEDLIFYDTSKDYCYKPEIVMGNEDTYLRMLNECATAPHLRKRAAAAALPQCAVGTAGAQRPRVSRWDQAAPVQQPKHAASVEEPEASAA